jgi:hypothetical protein
MKLFQHKDFDQAVIRAADYFSKRGLRPAIIEKDYYVSEALRVLPSPLRRKSYSREVRAWPRDGI